MKSCINIYMYIYILRKELVRENSKALQTPGMNFVQLNIIFQIPTNIKANPHTVLTLNAWKTLKRTGFVSGQKNRIACKKWRMTRVKEKQHRWETEKKPRAGPELQNTDQIQTQTTYILVFWEGLCCLVRYEEAIRKAIHNTIHKKS